MCVDKHVLLNNIIRGPGQDSELKHRAGYKEGMKCPSIMALVAACTQPKERCTRE